jgi:hypothetical protein
LPICTTIDKQFKKEKILWRKIQMKRAKKILCAALALIMALSLSVMPAFATGDEGETPAGENKDTPSSDSSTTSRTYAKDTAGNFIQSSVGDDDKIVEITDLPVMEAFYDDTGAALALDAILPDVTYTVTLTPVVYNAEKPRDGMTAKNTGKLPEGYTSTLTYEFTSITDTYIIKSFNMSSLLTVLTSTGEYWYDMTSTPSTQSAGLAFLKSTDPVTYLVKINVSDDADGNKIISQVRVYDGTKKIYNDQGVDDGKDGRNTEVRNVLFKNTTNFTTLTITNHIAGNDISKTTDFTYYIQIPAGGEGINLQTGESVPAKITKYNDDGVLETTVHNLKVGGNKANILNSTETPSENIITLADGEYITVDVPETMIFGVFQVNPDGYDVLTAHGYTMKDDNGAAILTYDTFNLINGLTTVAYDDRFVTNATDNGKEGCLYADENNTDPNVDFVAQATALEADIPAQNMHQGTIGITDNTVDFYNYAGHEVDTGIVLEVAPYAMIVVAAMTMGVLMISKKRKTDR